MLCCVVSILKSLHGSTFNPVNSEYIYRFGFIQEVDSSLGRSRLVIFPLTSRLLEDVRLHCGLAKKANVKL